MITLKVMRESDDWQQALNVSKVEKCVGATCEATPFGMEDIARIIHAVEGENDGSSWIAVVELKDGRYAFIDAWCDYTGWDCQSGGTAWLSHSYENIRQFGMTDPAKDRFAVAERAP